MAPSLGWTVTPSRADKPAVSFKDLLLSDSNIVLFSCMIREGEG